MPNVASGPGRLLDSYSVRARWSPVVLVVLPPLLLCFSLIPGLSAWSKLWPLLGAAGLVVLADQLGRDAGKRLQPSLWASWGGPPTTAGLRHRDTSNPVLLARRHKQIVAVTGQPLPTAADERADPGAADFAYEAAVAVLITRTRSRRQDFPLIYTENCNYGFRRNMLGLRPWGVRSTAVTILIDITVISLALAGLMTFPVSLLAVVLVVSAAAIVIWWRVVTPDWVRHVACAYADRLLEAAEDLPGASPSQAVPGSTTEAAPGPS